MKMLEIKRHLNKPDESYRCDLFKRGNGYVVLKYVNERPGRVGDVMFQTGSTTYAFYKTGMGYALWRMSGPDDRLKGYLFHICRDQLIGEDRLEYLYLLLDVWIDTRGKITILDRDEVAECEANGMIGEQDVASIACQEREITRNWRQIISEFDRLIS